MNPNALDLDTLRRLAIEQPAAGVTRLVALAVSAVFLIAVLDLVRRGRLKEEYTPIWVVVATGLMVSALWFDGVRLITRAVGAWTPSSTLFFFGLVFLLVLCLNYAVRLSGITGRMTALAQEVSLLREEIGRLRAAAGGQSGE
ncbi:MAG TPA: DUF2304 domain-containing protein [Candidatus Limnocylindria bacterium]|nr:DUF2304 domain-containing protein [Candidatus Limnocylindria bacterium]